ncbi:hypothetical protein [Phycisphaera mikurensis]|uniref:Uncharacterized protein n=1 Tax=Phycisphaera mikurensis (strain NBRC 102666 / KCTC 22515 / FYK2301M01) TaxID=1142394 RepID=I0ID96_PHYMF|nr:hypothetical protein [Phycisphaera mikurensis]MBB6442359.1 hypothetical protein [Phycisphaera mikurensis]BAM03234.1 hypothetical protein PSMK_10750 [Phycisphaera mikurensis NBRC 102666]
MLVAFSNRLGCGGSLLVSLVGSIVLIVAMLGLNACFTRGAPLVVPGPDAPASVGEAVGGTEASATPRTAAEREASG